MAVGMSCNQHLSRVTETARRPNYRVQSAPLRNVHSYVSRVIFFKCFIITHQIVNAFRKRRKLKKICKKHNTIIR